MKLSSKIIEAQLVSGINLWCHFSKTKFVLLINESIVTMIDKNGFETKCVTKNIESIKLA